MSRVTAGPVLARAGAAGLVALLALVTGPVPAGAADPAVDDHAGAARVLAARAATEPDENQTPQPEPTPSAPAATESASPVPEPTPTTPAAETPASPTGAPPTEAPATMPPAGTPKTAPPGPDLPGRPRLGVHVSTGDLPLTAAYWTGGGAVADLRVTVANTGGTRQVMRLGYRLPAGVSDAGTAGCAPAGDGHACGAWTADPGAHWTTLIRLRIAPDAWRHMPLSGSVRVTATAPGNPDLPAVSDDEGFAVLFPPGPPAVGVSLDADEVSFDISGQSSTLDVRLGNTGDTDSTGTVEVILPAGVTVPAPPANCSAVDAARTRCALGTVPAGGVGSLRLPVAATPDAQRTAPLSGAVIGIIDAAYGPTRRMQMSFRIVAAAATATPPVLDGAGPTGSQGVLPPPGAPPRSGPLTRVGKTAIALITVSSLLVVLALALATTSLRRRLRPEDRTGASTPVAAAD
ncbi:hypothetical protein [Polymorphospora sp. NPDC050346]|uniref:hypothetical protein n=1 Tax=Polymorphospora sp. NPDC050346 TaxID=3155780 RepID=UPI0033DBC8AC